MTYNRVKIKKTSKIYTIAINGVGKISGLEKIIFWSLMFVFGLTVSSYLYFVFGASFNIVERKIIENNTHILTTKIADMEFSYLNEAKNIDIARATELGFFEPAQMGYATKKAFSAKDSKMSNEI